MPRYTIEARSLPVVGLASHNFWVLRDENNVAIAELHGLATDRATGRPVPIGTDPDRFSLRIWHYPHDPDYAASLGVPADAASYIGNSNHVGTVLSGDRDEVMARWNAAVAAMDPINQLDIDYPAMGIQPFGRTINSNSAYRTLGEIMGVSIENVPGRLEPGVNNRMITPESIERLRTHGYPTLQGPAIKSDDGTYIRAAFETYPTSPGGTTLANLQPPQHALFEKALHELGPGLTARGQSAENIDRVISGLVAHSAEKQRLGSPSQFLLSHDGATVLVRHGEFLTSEMAVVSATAHAPAEHLASAVQMAHAESRGHSGEPETPRFDNAAASMEAPAHARV